MKSNFFRILLYYFSYFVIVLLLLRFYSQLNLEQIYKNFGLFGLYLFFSNTLIFDYDGIIKNKNSYFIYIITRIFTINFFIIFCSYFLNIVLFWVNSVNIQLLQMLSFSFQLFIILTIISLFASICDYKNRINNRDYDLYLYAFLIFSYIIYILESVYGKNVLFLNIYRYYCQDIGIYRLFFHYFIWLFIPFMIIYYRYFKKKY